MNDYDKLVKILTDYDIGYETKMYDITTDSWAEYHFGSFCKKRAYCIVLEAKTNNKVNGYNGFQARVVFDDAKKFHHIDIYE